jgi:hypothetical protein
LIFVGNHVLGFGVDFLPTRIFELKTPSRVNPASTKRYLKNWVLRRFSEEAIDKMQFDVVDLLVLSVGHVEGDKTRCFWKKF